MAEKKNIDSSSLGTEADYIFDTLVSFYRNSQHHSPDNTNVHSHRTHNLKSQLRRRLWQQH